MCLVGSSHSLSAAAVAGERAQACAGWSGDSGCRGAPAVGSGRAGGTRVRAAGPGLCRLAAARLPCQHEEAVQPV